jgi:hypothetical protein
MDTSDALMSCIYMIRSGYMTYYLEEWRNVIDILSRARKEH